MLLHERFAQHVAAAPAAPALCAGDEHLSYAQLDRAADNVAHVLRERGVRPGDVVAIEWPVSARFVTAMLGTLRLGAAFLPLDPAWPSGRGARLMEMSGAALLLTDDAGGRDRVMTGAELEKAAQAHCAAGIPPAVAERDAAARCYLMSTSGSTGEPRLVSVSHRAVAGLFANLDESFRAGPDAVWSSLHSAAFGYSQWEIWGALANGGCLTIVPPGMRGDPQAWAEVMRERGVTELSLTPSGLRQWFAAGAPAPGPQLRTVFVSGEALAPADVAAWYGLPLSPRPRLVSYYGLTETAGRVALHVLDETDALRDRAVIGTCAPDARIVLHDPDTGREVKAGEPGELLVAGPMLADGYEGDIAATAERFVELEGLRYLRTGDRAVPSEDGVFEFAGRTDSQFKLRGHRIEAAEIEQTLQAHPRIAQAGVAVTSGDAGQHLHAWVVPAASPAGIEFWPSLGEYQIYDDLLYDFMSADETRVDAYRHALDAAAPGRVVLDIGTGKDAVLARIAAQSGAAHVYAVEVLPEAAAHARALVERLGLADRITVIEGGMEDVVIPEPVEVCTQGIVGNIGSSDGIAPIWNAARRFFAPDCIALPGVCTTFIAPARLPDALRAGAVFGPLAAEYARRIFDVDGDEFDIRLCVRGFPEHALLAAPVEFERLDFQSQLSLAHAGEQVFEIDDAGWVDGYLLWTRLQLGSRSVDFLDHQQAWLPVWFPVGETALHVDAGAKLRLSWSCETPAGQVFPDYRIRTCLDGATDGPEYVSRHFETSVGGTSLHRALLASLREGDSFPDAAALREWVAGRLPQTMVPDRFHVAAALPLTASSKLDRDALAAMGAAVPGRAAADADEADSLSPLEQSIAAVWRDVLGHDAVGADTDFFDAGGDSISAVRLTTEMQRLLDATVFLGGLYETPTLRAYCDWLVAEHPGAVIAESAGGEDAAPAAVDDLPPLNHAQRNLWFLQRLYPDNRAANEQFVIRMRGVAERQVIDAWSSLALNHEALRLRILPPADDQSLPRQEAAPFDASLHDLVDVLDFSAAGDAEDRLRQLAQQEIRQSFDLQNGPLYRPVLAHMPAGDQALLVTAHHIAADGLCIELIRDELFAACRNGRLPAPATDFLDAVRAQSLETASGLDWWQRQLGGATLEPVLTPLTQPAAAGPEARLPFEIPAHLADAMRALAEASGASLFTIVLAAWRLWLARCFGRDDFLVGSPVTLRNTRDTAAVIGCMVNNVAFRNPVELQRGFAELLAAERDALRASLDHATVAFERIVEVMAPQRVYGRHPLFQFMLQFEERDAPATAGGMSFDADVLAVDRSSYWDMELSVTDRGAGSALQAFIGVRTDLFEAAAVAAWCDGFVAMLDAAMAEPQRAVATLPLLTTSQRHAALHTDPDCAGEVADTLCGLFFQQAARTPERPALADEAGVLDYGGLAERVRHLMRAFSRAGVAEADIVAVCVAPGRDMAALMLAINGIGATWLMLDPAYPQARLQSMLDAAGSAVLVTSAAAPALEHSRRTDVDALVDALKGSLGDDVVAESGDGPVTGGELLSVQFTSGSTGSPKGIALSQRAALSRLRWYWQRPDRNGARRFAQRTSPGFVDAIWEIFGPLLHGGQVAFAPADARRDMRALAVWLRRQGVEHLVIFPSALPALLAEWEQDAVGLELRHVIVTGEAVAAPLARRFAATLPGCALVNTYGLSETWDIATARVDTLGEGTLVPAGNTVPGVRATVRDARGELLPAAAPGQLWVAIPGLAAGYLNSERLSAERFRVHDDLPEFNTGDIASRRPNGELLLHGRGDRQIKLRGLRVEPGEIESLATSVAGVDECAAVVHGADAERAWLALYLGGSPDDGVVARVRTVLQASLPAALVPADIVGVDILPRTPSGKLNTRQLEQLLPARGDGGEPRTDTERTLAVIWRDILDCEHIERNDDFFALHGNSLLATRLIARLCDEFGLDLPLAAVFEEPTLAGLAAAVDALRWAASDQVTTGDDREVIRL